MSVEIDLIFYFEDGLILHDWNCIIIIGIANLDDIELPPLLRPNPSLFEFQVNS